MPATAGEPLRGCASIRVWATGVPDAEHHRFTAYLDAGFNTAAPADNATWEGAPGGTLTLRAKWQEVNNGTNDPTRFDVQVRTPGGAQIGATWSVPLADGVEQTRSVRFDSDPLDQDALDAIRAGTLEVFIEVQSTGGADPWGPFDSRGTQTDPPLTFSSASSSWARGYVRARPTLASFGASNIALGGAEPATFAYPDTTFNRVTLDAVLYRAEAITLEHRNGASTIRSQADAAATGVTRDYTWSGNSGATSRVHNAGSGSGGAYPAGQAGVRVILPVRDFGGDNELAWAAAGHQAGWNRIDDRTLEEPDRITIDPRPSFTQHLQLNDPAFAVAKRVTPAVRLESQQGNIWARLSNSRGEGVNLPGSPSGGQLEFTFRDPFGTTRATHTGATTTQDGEAGWIATSLLFDQALPGGTWVNTVRVVDAAGEQGSAAHTFILLAVDVQAVAGAGVDGSGAHFAPGQALTCHLSLVRADDGSRIVANSADVALIRFTANGQEHFDGSAWVTTAANPVAWLAMTVDPADARSYRRQFTDTAGWGHHDMTVVTRGVVAGSAFADQIKLEATATKNQHDSDLAWLGIPH